MRIEAIAIMTDFCYDHKDSSLLDLNLKFRIVTKIGENPQEGVIKLRLTGNNYSEAISALRDRKEFKLTLESE